LQRQRPYVRQRSYFTSLLEMLLPTAVSIASTLPTTSVVGWTHDANKVAVEIAEAIHSPSVTHLGYAVKKV